MFKKKELYIGKVKLFAILPVKDPKTGLPVEGKFIRETTLNKDFPNLQTKFIQIRVTAADADTDGMGRPESATILVTKREKPELFNGLQYLIDEELIDPITGIVDEAAIAKDPKATTKILGKVEIAAVTTKDFYYVFDPIKEEYVRSTKIIGEDGKGKLSTFNFFGLRAGFLENGGVDRAFMRELEMREPHKVKPDHEEIPPNVEE